MTQDELLLRRHLRGGQFLLGVAENRWRFRGLEWPYLLVTLVAKDGREFTLKLDCEGYPHQAPTGHLWNLQTQAPLPMARWPRSRGGTGVVSTAFRETGWSGAGKALYLPIDRAPLADHPDWRTHPSVWNPSVGICQYLQTVHEVLHGCDYDPQVDRSET